MKKLLFALFLFCALLVACNRSKDEQAAASKAPAASPAGDAVLKGSAFYLERIMLPPGGVLEVQLFSDRHADAPETLIAKQRFT
ncbi:MAG: YbaY family lipoprotein, partial [Rhodanobacteraceae bacterium]